jgi:predicted nuclease with TOPRIM domain
MPRGKTKTSQERLSEIDGYIKTLEERKAKLDERIKDLKNQKQDIFTKEKQKQMEKIQDLIYKSGFTAEEVLEKLKKVE